MWKFHNDMKKNTKIILSVVFAILFFIFAVSGNNNNSSNNNTSVYNYINKNEETNKAEKKKITIIDFSGMKEHEILSWCKDNSLNCKFERNYSDSIALDAFISQSVNAETEVTEGSKIIITYSLGKKLQRSKRMLLKK